MARAAFQGMDQFGVKPFFPRLRKAGTKLKGSLGKAKDKIGAGIKAPFSWGRAGFKAGFGKGKVQLIFLILEIAISFSMAGFVPQLQMIGIGLGIAGVISMVAVWFETAQEAKMEIDKAEEQRRLAYEESQRLIGEKIEEEKKAKIVKTEEELLSELKGHHNELFEETKGDLMKFGFGAAKKAKNFGDLNEIINKEGPRGAVVTDEGRLVSGPGAGPGTPLKEWFNGRFNTALTTYQGHSSLEGVKRGIMTPTLGDKIDQLGGELFGLRYPKPKKEGLL